MTIPKLQFRHKLATENIEIVDLSELSVRKSGHEPTYPHRLDFYLLIYISEGHGEHFIDFKKFSFQAGSFIFINKNQVHAFDLSHDPQGQMLLFTSEFIDELQANMRMPMFAPMYLNKSYSPVLRADQALKQSSEALITEIKKETEGDAYNNLINMHLFSALFLMLARSVSDKQALAKQEDKRFSHFIRLLENEFITCRDASVYAEKLHTTYKTLNQTCKQNTQQTAKQLIDTYTILESKRRLVIDNQSIQQHAYELGFAEPSNFIKYFKKHTGLTPAQFRKQIKG